MENKPSKPTTCDSSSVESEIYLFKLIESHCREIDSINNECKTKLPKLMSQRLPRFMRRRAASHNPKRIPASVRQAVVDRSEPKKSKKKANKGHKKKCVNKKKAELSLKKRHQKKERSVLHIWFAKRFRMRMHWNCLLPEKNNTKNQRLLYHNSKKDFVFYYMSFEVCLEVDYSKSTRQELIDFLAKFVSSQIGCTFAARTFEADNREGNQILYDYQSFPFKPLVSTKFLWNQTFAKLWLWTHVSNYETLIQILTDISTKDYSNKFAINGRSKQLERFRVIGPNGLDVLSRSFNFDFAETIRPEEVIDDSVHYFRFSQNCISSIKSSATNLFSQVSTSSETSKEFDFILIVKNRTFNNRFALDLIVCSDSAKTLWHRLAENRGHRVGGLEDLKLIGLNTSSLFFPFFGFIDVKHNESQMQRLKQVLNFDDEKEVYVLRNDSLVRKLSQNMSSKVMNELLPSDGQNEALLYVDLDCVDRGVPQLFDCVCLPTEEEIQKVCDPKINRNALTTGESESMDKLQERKIIGLIEFGGYCLETSRGKGLAVISITGLKEVIEINERINAKNNYKNSKIIASFKSVKSGLYRTVIVKLIDSLFST